jgi:sugar O-acyltransferase (sialic acid O-acetyltransferase NeuD family)
VTFYIAGAGGFGRETLDALCAARPSAAGSAVFLDDHARARSIGGIPVRRPGDAGAGTFVVAIADPRARRRLAHALLSRGLAAGQVLHPRAVVSPGAALGPGCVVLANAFVSTGAVLGAHVHVNYNATVGHDATLADFVTVLPGANIAGAVRVGAGATVGSNACVLQGLRIGSAATVGAGAVVTRDQPEGAVVAGVPARPLAWSGR